jgi:hypothetical protein
MVRRLFESLFDLYYDERFSKRNLVKWGIAFFIVGFLIYAKFFVLLSLIPAILIAFGATVLGFAVLIGFLAIANRLNQISEKKRELVILARKEQAERLELIHSTKQLNASLARRERGTGKSFTLGFIEGTEVDCFLPSEASPKMSFHLRCQLTENKKLLECHIQFRSLVVPGQLIKWQNYIVIIKHDSGLIRSRNLNPDGSVIIRELPLLKTLPGHTRPGNHYSFGMIEINQKT